MFKRSLSPKGRDDKIIGLTKKKGSLPISIKHRVLLAIEGICSSPLPSLPLHLTVFFFVFLLFCVFWGALSHFRTVSVEDQRQNGGWRLEC